MMMDSLPLCGWTLALGLIKLLVIVLLLVCVVISRNS
jgi:hypothetical protein